MHYNNEKIVNDQPTKTARDKLITEIYEMVWKGHWRVDYGRECSDEVKDWTVPVALCVSLGAALILCSIIRKVFNLDDKFLLDYSNFDGLLINTITH